MRTGIGPFFLRLGRAIAPRLSACAILVFLSSHIVIAAEFGAGPWIKGGTDIFAGVVPSQPGFYSRTDVYHYEADVSAVVFNGRVQVGVEQDMTRPYPR